MGQKLGRCCTAWQHAAVVLQSVICTKCSLAGNSLQDELKGRCLPQPPPRAAGPGVTKPMLLHQFLASEALFKLYTGH